MELELTMAQQPREGSRLKHKNVEWELRLWKCQEHPWALLFLLDAPIPFAGNGEAGEAPRMEPKSLGF